MEAITIKAYAKINLGLDVVKRLENGYHEVRMVMQTIGLYDELVFEPISEGICLRVDCGELPADESNLAWKAASLIAEHAPLPCGVRISLKKRIPMAAGLAGGSADAAAVFKGLNCLFSLGMTTEEMQRLGVRIGADVPFCIAGGTMLSEGIGEILTPVPPMPDCYLAIAKPDLFVSTKYVYENLHVDRIGRHPDMDRVLAALSAGDLRGLCASMENILETVTEKEYPVIARIKEQLKRDGALTALMSGSGPTVFGVFEEEAAARAALLQLKEMGLAKELFVTTRRNADEG